jgi:hypothetical protein
MRLNKLYRGKVTIGEDRTHPLELQRLPPVHQRISALPFKAASSLNNTVEELDRKVLPDTNPDILGLPIEEQLKMARKAYNELKMEIRKHPISGLAKNTHLKNPQDYIIIVGDVDNMKWLNTDSGLGHKGVNTVLRTIGKLLNEKFEYQSPVGGSGVAGSGIRHTRAYHPHGDEFVIVSYVKGLSKRYASQRLVALLETAVDVANTLAGVGFTHESDLDNMHPQGVQATMSFAISDDLKKAHTLLAKAKGEAKYSLVIDSELLDKLDTRTHCNRELKGIIERCSNVNDSIPITVMGESQNKALDILKGRKGIMLLECSYGGIPENDRMELEELLREKWAYLTKPGGVFTVALGPEDYDYLPLKEAYGG